MEKAEVIELERVLERRWAMEVVGTARAILFCSFYHNARPFDCCVILQTEQGHAQYAGGTTLQMIQK